MSSHALLGTLSLVIAALGYVFYFRGILVGKIKPHFFSWFIWGILGSIAFAAQFSEGGGPGAWVVGFTTLICFVVAAIGLGSTSRIYITRSDWFFFLGAFAAIPAWYVTGDPLWSVIIVTLLDFIAFVPTLRKAYLYPETESVGNNILATIKFALSVLALDIFTWTTSLYPLSLVLVNFAYAIMLILRRHQLKALTDD
jgi:hypothetical protein